MAGSSLRSLLEDANAMSSFRNDSILAPVRVVEEFGDSSALKMCPFSTVCGHTLAGITPVPAHCWPCFDAAVTFLTSLSVREQFLFFFLLNEQDETLVATSKGPAQRPQVQPSRHKP